MITDSEINWRKSTRSNASNGGNCVEVAELPGRVLVRDSKLGEGSPVLDFSAAAWSVFLGTLK